MNDNHNKNLLLDDQLLKMSRLFPGQVYCKNKEGYYLYCNQNYANSIGLTDHDNIVGKNDYDFMSTSEADHVWQNDLDIIKSAKSLITFEKNRLLIKIPLLDKNNQSYSILCLSLKVDEIQSKIEKNLQMLDNIIAAMPWHIYWKDKNGVLLGCNDQQAIDLGLKSRQEIIGKTDYDIVSKTIPEEERIQIAKTIEQADKEIMTEGKSKTIEEYIVRLDGTESHYLSEKKPLLDNNGETIGLLGISVDITERKQLEEKLRAANVQAEKANALKTEFIQNMQHDIRTPISGIFSLLDNMEHSNNLQEFQRAIPYAAKASRELLELCNDVIDFENVEYGEKPLYSRKFSLINLMHSVINLNSAAALTHDTSLLLDISNEVPDIIKGDDYRLRKILINLVGNAVKFTEHGQITLSAHVASQVDKKITLRFAVADTGIGIPVDQLDKIFEKFTRLNPSNTGKFKGTGLGLHIVKKFASEISAELDVISEMDKGTTFTLDVCFEIPLVAQLVNETKAHVEQSRHLRIESHKFEESSQDDIKLIESAPNKSNIVTQGLNNSAQSKYIRVLLIEDDYLAMKGAESQLLKTNKNCQIFKAIDAAEALQLLESELFDLVISDLGLPDNPGFYIVKMVKKNKDHINYNTPFVALTAHSDDAKREQAKESGFLHTFNKPLTKELAEKILADYVPNEDKKELSDVVDFETWKEMMGNNPDTIIEMLNMLVKSFSKERYLFSSTFAANDFTRARELFHKFRGGLSYVRVPTVERLAKELHEEVKQLEIENGNLKNLNDKLETMFKAVDAVAFWLENYNKDKE